MELFSNYNDDLRMVWKDGTYYHQWAHDEKLYPISNVRLKFWQVEMFQIQKQLRKLKLEKLLTEDL